MGPGVAWDEWTTRGDPGRFGAPFGDGTTWIRRPLEPKRLLQAMKAFWVMRPLTAMVSDVSVLPLKPQVADPPSYF